MSYPSVGRWDVIACVDVQGDVCWCNRLDFLDPGAISRQIVFALPGNRRKNIVYPWSGSVVS